MSNTLDTLQNHINDKARAQAIQEWGELENLIAEWFKNHPAKHSRIARHDPRDYSSGRPPLMRLNTFPARIPELEDGFGLLASNYVKDRTEVLSTALAAELIQKASLIP